MPVRVFETLLIIDGVPIEAEGHMQRLQKATGIDATDFLKKTAAKLSGYHRLRIDFTPPNSLTAESLAIPIPALLDGKFSRFQLITKQLSGKRLHAGHGQHKLADKRELEKLEAQVAPALPLLIDDTAHILETSRHNVFVIEEKSLVTPPLDGRILPGVTRLAILDEAKKLGIIHREEPILLQRALVSNGMFLSNAVIGMGWVEQCNEVQWPEISPLAQALHKNLADRWQRSLKSS